MVIAVTPSKTQQEPMTDKQIDKAVDHYRHMLKKHRRELPADVMQVLFSTKEHDQALLGLVQGLVHERAMYSFRVRRDPQLTMEKEFGKCDGEKDLVRSAPPALEDEVELLLFQPYRQGYLDEAGEMHEYIIRGLKPASPLYLAVLNQDDKSLSEGQSRHTRTMWQVGDGEWGFASFRLFRHPHIGYNRRDLHRYSYQPYVKTDWWYVGVRK